MLSYLKIKKILEYEIIDLVADNKVTIREYLKLLLTTLWSERDRFSGKRPLGNRNWEYDLYASLIKHKAIDGNIDDYGYIENCDNKAGNEIINRCIDYIFNSEYYVVNRIIKIIDKKEQEYIHKNQNQFGWEDVFVDIKQDIINCDNEFGLYMDYNPEFDEDK